MTELLRVFLCHSSQDKQIVRNLCDVLLSDGFDVWLDENKLLPGQDWEIEISRAVRNSHIVVICLSQNSIGKEGYVQKEIRVALDVADEKPEGTIFLIPARLDDCTVPYRLLKWQWVDLFESNGYQKLQNSLNLRMASLGLNKLPPLMGSGELFPEINPSRRDAIYKALEQIKLPLGEFVISEFKDAIKDGYALDRIIAYLQDAVRLHPRHVALWQTLGDAYMRSNRLYDALDAYTKAEEILRE